MFILCALACIPACANPAGQAPKAEPAEVQTMVAPISQPKPITPPAPEPPEKIVPPAEIKEPAKPTDPKAENPDQSVAGLFKGLQARFEKIDDYQCVFDAFVAKDEQTDRRVYNYYFKKDKRIRMEILQGKNSGATLVYNEPDVVVRPSGFFISLFTFTFAPEDKKICDLRGFTIPQSDWGTFIEQHIKYLDKYTARTGKPEQVDGRTAIVIEIESAKPEETMDIAKEKIWLDEREKVLLKFEQYDKSGKLIRANSYKDIKINSGLKDELFSSP
jgi:outer membrane lipoprotein-sorting protein